MRAWVRIAVGVLACAGGAAVADPVDIALVNEVAAGRKPALVLTAKEAVAVVTLDIERQDDHRSFHYKAGPLRVGQKAELDVGDGKSGHASWKGKLVLRGAWGESSNDVTFDSQVGGASTSGGVKVTYDRAHLDLEHGVLQFQVSRPVMSAELAVIADDATEIARVIKSLASAAPKTWLSIEWVPSGKTVLRLELKLTSANGDVTTVKLVPWSVAIAHEEVVFPSGQATIQPSEIGKLVASYDKIVSAAKSARTHEPTLDVRVYVAGHTDTVGKSDDNRTLSQARAKAIAAWLRAHGLSLPVYYAGFGEDQPKVKTPDDTDEPRNRRADYVVGVEEPQNGRGKYTVLP